ncbi:MAG: sarcosine oxidase subunit gamma family protein [Rhizobium sp.]|nr:sarcosine oxidase subunit gamma family protein [Rhizobium sp.]
MNIERRPPVRELVRTLGDGTRLNIRAGGTILLLLTRPASIDEASIRQRLSAPSPVDLRPFSPGQWLLVSDAPLDQVALALELKDEIDIVDQSQGRVRLELTGPNVEQMLAHATALDLHAGLAASTITLLGHIGVHITRMAPDLFELIVMRSFAESLVDEITRMCRLPQLKGMN